MRRRNSMVKVFNGVMGLFFVFWFLAGNAKAEESKSNVLVSVGSHHTGTFDYNNNNFGLGFETEVDEENELWAGALQFKNSYNKNSTMLFVTKRSEALSFGSFTPHLSIGVANNYEDDANSFNNGLLGFAAVGLDMKINEDVSLRVNTTAPFSSIVGGDTVTHFMLVFKY